MSVPGRRCPPCIGMALVAETACLIGMAELIDLLIDE